MIAKKKMGEHLLTPKECSEILAPYRKDGTVKGLHVGGCVNGTAASAWKGYASAHAHWGPTSKHRGWICVRPEYLTRPSLLHELAHLLTGGKGADGGHGKAFFAKVKELHGGKLHDGDRALFADYNRQKLQQAEFRKVGIKEVNRRLRFDGRSSAINRR